MIKMYKLNEEDRKQLKKVQLELFKKFLKICQDNQLRYFVCGGTALGAARHGGYVPWDDDIDVLMPRKDYEAFVDISSQQFSSTNYFLQTYLTDKDYRNGYAKIRDKKTTYIEASSCKLKICHGIYIDIFPLDGYSIDDNIKKTIQRKQRWANYYCSKDYMGIYVGVSAWYILLSRCKRMVNNLLASFYWHFKPTWKVLDEMDCLYKQCDYDSSDMTICYSGQQGNKNIIEKRILGKGCMVKFEGIDVIAPEKLDEFLTYKFGEYMKIPPKEQQVAHHYCKTFSGTVSYTEYIKEK